MTHGPDPAAGSPVARELFYGGVVDVAELRAAIEKKDIDEEIAVLRVKLKEHIKDNPEDLAVMLKSIDLIVRSAATRYRMSDKRAADLGAAIAATIDLINGQIGE